MVKVISKNGVELAPTNRHGKIRHMLKEKRCKVVNKDPFTVRLMYDPTPVPQAVR